MSLCAYMKYDLNCENVIREKRTGFARLLGLRRMTAFAPPLNIQMN